MEHPVEHSEDFTTLQVPAANLGHKYDLHVYNEVVSMLKTVHSKSKNLTFDGPYDWLESCVVYINMV